MENTPKSASVTSDGDVDLGRLFYKTGGYVSTVFSSVGRGLSSFGHLLLSILFFLRRNLLWLAAGIAAGLAVGIYQLSKTGPKYTATLTVRTNFHSSRSLYGTMDFLNALVSGGRYNELATFLNIQPEEAKSLTWFEASPVESEIIAADLYRDQFLNSDGYRRLDTFWMKTISYSNFKNSLTKFDYPLHDIRVYSTNATVFIKIQDGIINKISTNKLLTELKDTEHQTNIETVDLLQASLRKLDTLSNSYNKRIASGPGNSEPGNNIMFLEGNRETRSPELELYDKILELKNQLNATKMQGVLTSQVIQIYSPFSYVGKKDSFFRQNLVTDSVKGFVAALVIICFVGLYRYLKALEKKASKSL